MAMSQEDMFKRARQLKKQKVSTVGIGSSFPPPQTEVQEELSEPEVEPLIRKSILSQGKKKMADTTSQNSISQLQTPFLQQQIADDTKLSFWNPKFPISSMAVNTTFFAKTPSSYKLKTITPFTKAFQKVYTKSRPLPSS